MKLAYCGDVCNLCPRYIATLSGKEEELNKVAILLKKVGWRDEIKPPEEMICHGCQDIEVCEYDVKDCCIEKKIENCGKCPKYPCPEIKRAFEITETNTKKFRKILSKEEYETFYNAYFLKKEHLDREQEKKINIY